jgi:hypothetical protein
MSTILPTKTAVVRIGDDTSPQHSGLNRFNGFWWRYFEVLSLENSQIRPSKSLITNKKALAISISQGFYCWPTVLNTFVSETLHRSCFGHPQMI